MPDSSFDLNTFFQLAFFVGILMFTIHAVIVGYHWFSFGADQCHSKIAVVVHVGVGVSLIVVMALSLLSI